ncbi:MAG: RNA methyltransferase [Bacteroidia bacterium]|nr:RNA methyltransferase [Bacteroidia bacterium]
MKSWKELSQAKQKQISRLVTKKGRCEEGAFLVEGIKLVKEAFRSGLEPQMVIISPLFLEREGIKQEGELRKWLLNEYQEPYSGEVYYLQHRFFEKLTDQSNPEGILALVEMPVRPFPATIRLPALFLWQIQDPGNLGTLIRTAEWFGFQCIIASEGTVDCWNPKVVRASMGSIFRIPVYYPENWFQILRQNVNHTVAAALNGKLLRPGCLRQKQCLLLGNEANGLPSEIVSISSLQTITIPGGINTESLNVSIAGAILMYQMAIERIDFST